MPREISESELEKMLRERRDQRKADELYRDALRSVNTDNPSNAEQLLTQAASLIERSPDAYYEARVYSLLGRVKGLQSEESVSYFERALGLVDEIPLREGMYYSEYKRATLFIDIARDKYALGLDSDEELGKAVRELNTIPDDDTQELSICPSPLGLKLAGMDELVLAQAELGFRDLARKTFEQLKPYESKDPQLQETLTKVAQLIGI